MCSGGRAEPSPQGFTRKKISSKRRTMRGTLPSEARSEACDTQDTDFQEEATAKLATRMKLG